MEKLLKYCLSALTVVLFVACQTSEPYYKKDFNESEKEELAEHLLNGMGYRYYYQGSVGEQFLLEEAEYYNNKHAELWRERGIPYLKRGIAWGYLPNYEKCVLYDSLGWQGYRGYCTLYFYRDYQRALDDFDQLDVLTPDFIDYPQATSIDYMRGLCYVGLGNGEKGLEYMGKHITHETETVGVAYIPTVAFIAEAKAHELLGQKKEMQAVLELAAKHNPKSSDVSYYLAELYLEQGRKDEAVELLEEAKVYYEQGFGNSRPYVEEFYQVYLMDIEELLGRG